MNKTSASLASTPAPPGRGERASASAYRTEASSHTPAFEPRTLTPHHGRQAVEQQTREGRVASQVAADEPGRRATAAISQLTGSARQHFAEIGVLGRQQTGLRIHEVPIALGEDDGIAGLQPQGGLAVELDIALALGDQVEDHDPLRSGFEDRRRRNSRRGRVAPGRGETSADEDRAHQAHDAKRLRQRIHQLADPLASMLRRIGIAVAIAAETGARRWASTTSSRS